MTTLRPLRSTRTRAGAGLIMAGLLALTACGRDDAEPVPAPSMATATEALPSMDMTPFTLDVPSLGLERVPGASLAVLEGADPEYHAAWLSVPGAPAWTAAMDRTVRDQLAAYERDTDRAADPVLDIQPRLAVAGPDAAAARLLATEQRGDRSVSAVQTVWYSAREDRVAATPDLFTNGGWDDFRNEVRERMATDPAIVQDRLTSAVEQPDRVENSRVWDALVFLPDGSALLEVDQAAMAPADAGILTARIPADTVRPWLSEVGLAAQDAARTPGTVRLPERAPASSTPATSPGSPTGVPGGAVPAPGTTGGIPGGLPGSGTPGSATDPEPVPASGSSSGSRTDVGSSTSAPAAPPSSAPSGTGSSAPSAPPTPPSSAPSGTGSSAPSAPPSSAGASSAPGGPTTSAPAPTPTGGTPMPAPSSPSAPTGDPTPTVPGDSPTSAPTSSTTAPAPTPASSSPPGPTTTPAPDPVPVPEDPSTPAPPPSGTAPTAAPDPSATATAEATATATAPATATATLEPSASG